MEVGRCAHHLSCSLHVDGYSCRTGQVCNDQRSERGVVAISTCAKVTPNKGLSVQRITDAIVIVVWIGNIGIAITVGVYQHFVSRNRPTSAETIGIASGHGVILKGRSHRDNSAFQGLLGRCENPCQWIYRSVYGVEDTPACKGTTARD